MGDPPAPPLECVFDPMNNYFTTALEHYGQSEQGCAVSELNLEYSDAARTRAHVTGPRVLPSRSIRFCKKLPRGHTLFVSTVIPDCFQRLDSRTGTALRDHLILSPVRIES